MLSHLALAGPLTVTEAAQHMNRAQPVMSEIVIGLERKRKRLVARVADARDRRRILVWLTEAGQAQLAKDPELRRPRAVRDEALGTASAPKL